MLNEIIIAGSGTVLSHLHKILQVSYTNDLTLPCTTK